MNWLRRALIEFWAMIALSVIIGFLGPFGTYNNASFLPRCGHWLMQLMGAYVLVRPSILLWDAVADAASLPRRHLVFWGVLLSSAPLAMLWAWSSSAFFRGIGGFEVLLPFAALCALAVLGVAAWARWADRRHHPEPAGNAGQSEGGDTFASQIDPLPGGQSLSGIQVDDHGGPRLAQRLSPKFEGRIVALQSEDHYVRVHGERGSELLFMRLRDAIGEMDGEAGEQVHRSWWIAAGSVANVEMEGRKRIIRLPNGASAPIARDSVARLERMGFLQVLGD